MSIGTTLRLLRTECGLSQEAAAAAADVPLPKLRVLEAEEAPTLVRRLLAVYSGALARSAADRDPLNATDGATVVTLPAAHPK